MVNLLVLTGFDIGTTVGSGHATGWLEGEGGMRGRDARDTGGMGWICCKVLWVQELCLKNGFFGFLGGCWVRTLAFLW